MLNNYITRTPKPKNDVQQNDDELNELKKTLEKLESKQIDPDKIDSVLESSLKLAFKNSIVSNDKHKRDASLKVFDIILKDYIKDLKKFDFTDQLTEEYLSKLVKIYESSNEQYVLCLVQNLIQYLGKILHHQLPIVNAFLQIMELSFKHSNNDIKARGYDAWIYLIKNFAIDPEFLLKPKKLSLLLMPLTNKTRQTKNEQVSKSKALAWICLIEQVNSKITSQLNTLVIPFFNFCLAEYLNNGSGTDSTMSSSNNSTLSESSQSGKNTRPRRSVSTNTIKAQCDALLIIAFEFYISFICNGNSDNIPIKISDRNFNLNETFNNFDCWNNLLKYFFNVFIPNSSHLEANLMLLSWSRLKMLLEKNEEEQRKLAIDECKLGIDQEDGENDSSLMNLFLINTIELLNQNYDLITSHSNKKNQQETNTIQRLGNHVTKYLFEFLKSTKKSNKVKQEIEKNIKELIQMMLQHDEQNETSFLNNLGLILQSIEKSSVNDYELWLILTNKVIDFYKSRKSKYSNNRKDDDARPNYDAIHELIVYPFGHFKAYGIEQPSDIKQLTTLTNNLLKSTIFSLKYYQLDQNLFVDAIIQRFFDIVSLKTQKIVELMDEYQLVTQLVNNLVLNYYEFNAENLNEIKENKILLRIMLIITNKINEDLKKEEVIEDFCKNNQSQLTSILVNQIDVIIKLLTTYKSHKNIDKLLIILAKLVYSMFDTIQMLYGHVTKKLIDHFDSLFDEINECLSKKLNLVHEYEPNHMLESLEPIIYSILIYSSTKKTKSFKQKFISTWNSSFGKYTTKILVYSDRLRKALDELNEDIRQHSLTTIALPGFNSMIEVSNSSMAFLGDNKMDDIREEHSISSSSVPVVQLIKINHQRVIEDEVKPQSQSQASKFSFSPATDKKSQFNLSTKSPKTPSSANLSNSQITSSGTKRKLELSELIDQEPEENFVKIEEKKSTFFKTPLTEHQKEVRKEKSFIPIEIHNESSNLTSALMIENSASCTQDFIAEAKESQKKNDEEDVYEFKENEREEVLPLSKRLCVELNKNSINKLQFVSKIKPDKMIDVIEIDKIDEKEDKPVEAVDDNESVMEVDVTKEENSPAIDQSKANQEIKHVDPPKNEEQMISVVEEAKINENLEEAKVDKTVPEAKKDEKKEDIKEELNETGSIERRRSTRIKTKLSKCSSEEITSSSQESQASNEDNNLADDEELLIKQKEKSSKTDEILKLKNGKVTKPSNIKRSKSLGAKPELKGKIQKLVDDIIKSSDVSQSEDDTLPLLQLVNVNVRRGRSKSLAPLEPIILDDKQEKSIEIADNELMEIDQNEVSKENISTSEQKAKTPTKTQSKPLEVINENEILEGVSVKKPTVQQHQSSSISSSSSSTDTTSTDSDCFSSENDDKPLIKFTKSQTPTASILKKRKTLLNPEDLTNDRDTPSKRRVSFCDSVQVEEIEPNANKSIFRSTPRMPNKKLVVSPFLNKSQPQSANVSNSSNLESNLLETIESSTSQQPNSPLVQNKMLNGLNKNPSISTTQSPASQQTAPSSPGGSLLSNFFNNKQGFLSQRTAMIQQQMQQSKNESISSPMSQTSLQIIPASVTSAPKSIEEQAIYPALKDCLLSVDRISSELASSMWSSGITQLLKSKNIITISDLCMLPQREINELPFKTPKVENFLKIIQKFQQSLTKQIGDEQISETNTPVAEAKSRSATPLGSLEEEMAKLEDDSNNILNTSIECETQQTTEIAAAKESESNITNIIEYLIKSDNEGFNIDSLKDQLKNIEQSELFKLLTQINTINLRLNQANNFILNHLNNK